MVVTDFEELLKESFSYSSDVFFFCFFFNLKSDCKSFLAWGWNLMLSHSHIRTYPPHMDCFYLFF